MCVLKERAWQLMGVQLQLTPLQRVCLSAHALSPVTLSFDFCHGDGHPSCIMASYFVSYLLIIRKSNNHLKYHFIIISVVVVVVVWFSKGQIDVITLPTTRKNIIGSFYFSLLRSICAPSMRRRLLELRVTASIFGGDGTVLRCRGMTDF